MLAPDRYRELGVEMTVCPACGYRCPGSYHYCPACGVALLPPDDDPAAGAGAVGTPVGGLGSSPRDGPVAGMKEPVPLPRLIPLVGFGVLVGAVLGALAVWASRP